VSDLNPAEAHTILVHEATQAKSVAVAHALRELAKHLQLDAFAPRPANPARIARDVATLFRDHGHKTVIPRGGKSE
jgi:hypothetical protein